MTTVVTEAPETFLEGEALAAWVALIACGVNSYPGKTKACEIHQKKGQALVNIASKGAVDALAAAICSAEKLRACVACTSKAVEIMRVYNQGTA